MCEILYFVKMYSYHRLCVIMLESVCKIHFDKRYSDHRFSSNHIPNTHQNVSAKDKLLMKYILITECPNPWGV